MQSTITYILKACIALHVMILIKQSDTLPLNARVETRVVINTSPSFLQYCKIRALLSFDVNFSSFSRPHPCFLS